MLDPGSVAPHQSTSHGAPARTSCRALADRSGGLIVFEAESGAPAEAPVANDPFLREHLLERRWVKQWLPD